MVALSARITLPLSAWLAVVAPSSAAEIRMGFLSQEISSFCVATGGVHEAGLTPFSPEAAGVTLKRIQITVSQAPVMVSNGDLDTAECAGPSGVAQAWSKGGRNAVIVYVGSTKPSYVLIGGKSIKTLADLKGKIVGSPGPQSTAMEASAMILRRGAGLVGERDYRIVSAGTGGARAAALGAGKIDAIPSYPPFSYRMIDDGFNFLGDEADYVPKYVSGTIVANRAWAQANSDALVALIESFLRATAWLNDPANKEAAIANFASLVTEGPGPMGPEHARRFYHDVVDAGRMTTDGYADAAALQSNFDIMVERGSIAAGDLPKPADVADYTWLNLARRKMGLPEVPVRP